MVLVAETTRGLCSTLQGVCMSDSVVLIATLTVQVTITNRDEAQSWVQNERQILKTAVVYRGRVMGEEGH